MNLFNLFFYKLVYFVNHFTAGHGTVLAILWGDSATCMSEGCVCVVSCEL